MFFDYRLKNFNIRILIYVLLLNTVGVLVINSASNGDSALVNKQVLGIVVGLAVAVGLSLVSYRFLLRFWSVVYIGSIVLLFAVLLFGVEVNRATRWIELPVIGQFQPSEFAKMSLIVTFAWFFAKNEDRINQIKILFMAAVLYGIPIYLILEQPNLSTSIVITFFIACMLFAAGLSYRWILGVIAACVPVGALFMFLPKFEGIPFLRGYQAQRILAFFNRAENVDSNLQQDNSIMAIGSGLLKGKGLNNNTLASVKNGNFLSEEQTDFIFAVVGEELGFRGCVIVIVLFALIVIECILLAHRAQDMSGRLICVGVASLIGFQSFANIAVATGMLPNTGLPLPFISYGVSSLVSMYIGIGLVLNVGLQRKISN